MILTAHSDTGFHNESKGRSRSGAHIFLYEDDPIPRWNGPILSIAQVIKFARTSATETELDALYITAQKQVPMRKNVVRNGMDATTHPYPNRQYNS